MIRTYIRDERYWEAVRNEVIRLAQNWSRGTEGAVLLELALGEDWCFHLQQYAPAGQHICARDCAGIIIRNFLILQ